FVHIKSYFVSVIIIMPEGVEVFWTAQWLNSRLRGQQINQIHVMGGRYRHQAIPGFELFNQSKPWTIDQIQSKGKTMWFKLTGADQSVLYLFNRFGLTGEWKFSKDTHSVIELVINKEHVYF